MTTPAKQVAKMWQANVGISGFTSSGGASDNVTTVLTTALQTAGDAGTGVPLQVGSRAGTLGVDTTPGKNVVLVFNSSTGLRYVDSGGNDVYGKITNAGNVWTVNYFSVISGTETAFSMPASATLSLEFPYIFSFELLPYDALRAVTDRHVAPDLASFAFRMFSEVLTVTATNTLSQLSQTYKAGTPFILIVNNFAYTNLGTTPAVSVSGTAVTWNPNAPETKFALSTSDTALAIYGY